MFDFAWSEIALIAVVAMIAIGPKDMPVAIRAVTGWIKKARRMAAEFQTHVDEMVREADLSEVRNSINEIRNFDFRGEIEKAIDPDGSIRDTFASNPLEPTRGGGAATSVEEIAVSEPAAAEPVRSEPAAEETGGGRGAVPAGGAGLRAAQPGAACSGAGLRASRRRRPSSRRECRAAAPRASCQPEPTTMADIEEDDPIDDKPMPLLEHLVELRRRLMWSIGAFVDLLHRRRTTSPAASTSSWPSRWRPCCASRAIRIRT